MLKIKCDKCGEEIKEGKDFWHLSGWFKELPTQYQFCEKCGPTLVEKST